MSNNKDNVSLLYNGLIKKGYTQEDLGDESTFREKMSDENNRRELYDYVSGRGDFRIGDYNTYMSRLDEAYTQPKSDDDAVFEANAERFRNGQPTERVTTQSMIDAHPELGLGEKSYQYKPDIPNLPTLEQHAYPDKTKDGKFNIGKPGFVQDEATALYPMSQTSLNERLSDPYIFNKDMSLRAVDEAKEEEEIDKFYVSKPMNTAKDVYDNFSSRFTNTKRGIELGEELAKINKDIQDKYVSEYLASDDYKALASMYKGEDLSKRANEQFGLLYGDAINKELMPYRKAYNEELHRRYGKQMDKELNRINKEEAGAHARELMTSVDSELEDVENRIAARAKAVRNLDWKPGMPSSRDDKKLAELRGERAYLEGAKELIDDSQKILNAVEAEKDGNFFGGLGRGVRDSVFDIDTWTMGLSDLVGGIRLRTVLEKAERGENLTSAEERLLDASVNNMAVNFYYRNDLGRGYQAGEITGQSIPFMLEFIVNPVSASGNSIAKSLLNYGMKRFAVGTIGKTATKVGTRLVGDAIAAGGVTATSGLGNVMSGTVERLNRNYEYGLDEEGNLRVSNTNKIGLGEAFAKSATTAFLERQSEMIFNAFKGAPSLFKGVEMSLPGGVNTFMNYISNSRVGELWRGIKNNTTMRELAQRAQFHGLGEEYLEEVYNNFANIPLGEMTFEEATDLEKNIVTFLGLAPTQLMFGVLGGISYGVERYKARRDMERTFGRMTEEQKRKLMELQEMGKLSTNRDIAIFLAETINDENLTPEQKRDEIEYAYNLAKQNAIDEMSNTDIEDVVESDNVQIDAATDPQTGMYGEVIMIDHDENGEQIDVTVNVYGEKIVNGKLYLLVEKDGQKEYIRPMQYYPETYQKRPAEQVKAVNEEMIREEAAAQAERESKYAPEVMNYAPHPQDQVTDANGQVLTVAGVTPDGVTYLDEQGLVNQMPIDSWRDLMQAQIDAQEAAQKQAEEAAANTQAVVNNMPRKTDETGRIFVPKSVQGDEVAYDITDAQGNVLEQGTSKVLQFAKMQDYVAPVEEQLNDDGASVSASGESVGEQVNAGVNAEKKELSSVAQKVNKRIEELRNSGASQSVVSSSILQEVNSAKRALNKAKKDLESPIRSGVDAAVEMKKRKAVLERAQKMVDEYSSVFEELGLDEKAFPFIKTSSNTYDFGMIDEGKGLKSAPIRLSQGYNKVDDKGNNHGYGLEHIEAGHGEQIKKAGFESVEDFISAVASNYQTIRKGNKRNGEDTYLLEVSDGKNNTLFIELAKDGRYWNVNSAGIFREGYSKNKEVVWSLPAVEQASTAEASEVQDSAQSSKAGNPLSGNSPQTTSSVNKDNKSNVQSQAKEQKPLYEREKSDVFRELGDTYGEKMPHKVEVTAKFWADKVKNAQKKVDEAQQKLDDAPIGEDDKPKTAVDKAQRELDAIKREADFWAEIDAEIKSAQLRRSEILNPQAEVELSNEPMTADEFVAQQLAASNIVLNKDDYMRETGFGSEEANFSSLEDFVLQMEAAEVENPFMEDRADEIMAIFAEEAAKYEQSLNNTENEQGRTNEVAEGSDTILSEEQSDDTGGTEERSESERVGDGIVEEGESAHVGGQADEVELKQQEGETILQFAERVAEENRRRPLRKRANEWSKALGVKVTLLESIDDVDARTRVQIEEAHAEGSGVPGWVASNGEVFFFMPDLHNMDDVDNTYIHEVVAHIGLPKLLGEERFNEFCDKVWEMMPQSQKDFYEKNYPGVKGIKNDTLRHRRAADEYIAYLAEKESLTPEEKTIWDNIVKLFRDMLDKALDGIIGKSKITNEDISNLIKASYANLKSGAERNVSGEGTRFRFSKTPQEFDAIQKEAVEKKGIVMPGLNEASVDVFGIDKHDFNGNLKQAREAAKQWAIENYQGKEFSLPDNGGSYTIGKKAINKYVDKTSIDKSDNAMIHLSALKELPNIISSSITGEIHADYKKGENGERSAENGVGDKGLLVHRMFGAVELDGKVYRVKTTMNEYRDPMANNTPHSYEVTEIELIESSSTPSLKDDSKPVNVSNNSITAAKLLNGVEKSYDKGKKLLSESEKTRFRFIGERGARNLDKAEEATTRLDNLSVAREMEAAEKDAKSIKMATGWERGADGKWRYEVKDHFDVDAIERFVRGAYGKTFGAKVPLERVLKDDDTLLTEYPQLKETSVKFQRLGDSWGVYYPESNEIAINTNFIREEREISDRLERQKELVDQWKKPEESKKIMDMIKVLELNPEEELKDAEEKLVGIEGELEFFKNQMRERLETTIIHEVQHAIQHIEGFEHGGSKSTVSNKMQQLKHDVVHLYEMMEDTPEYAERERLTNQWFEDTEKDFPKRIDEINESGVLSDIESLQKALKAKYGEDANVSKIINSPYRMDADIWNNLPESFYDNFEAYQSLSGEVEARNAARRSRVMNEEEMREYLASETEDVAREDQIFLNGALEEGTRFRISDKGRKIQNEVDKFTSKYNSVPVDVIESGMTDKELVDAFDNKFGIDDIRNFMKTSKTMGGYIRGLNKVIIFADRMKPERMEESLFHENIHALMYNENHSKLLAWFYEFAKDDEAFAKWREISENKEYELYERPEEFFAYVVSNGMVADDLEGVFKHLDGEMQNELKELLNKIGYDYDVRRRSIGQSDNGRTDEGTPEESVVSGDARKTAREQSERLGNLFGQVADMGLDGVLGNKEYTRLMVDIYKELPENVRTSLADDALRHYGGSVAPAVSDYVNKKGKANLWDKIAGFVREALRKVGIDVNLNANDAKYILWRSRKPLDRNNLLDIAEDIDMRYRLKVGEFDDSPTRLRSIEEVNDDYNRRLDELDNDRNQKDRVLRLGKPGRFLNDGGVSGSEIEMEFDKFVRKSNDNYVNDHPFTAGDIKNLPKAINAPIAVFDSTNHKDKVILTELKKEDNNFIVVIKATQRRRKGGVVLEVNEISTLYPKNAKGIVKWINDGLITNVDKRKALDWLEALHTHRGTGLINQELDSATKIVESFENPKIEGENVRKNGGGTRFRVDVGNKLNIRDEYEATIKKGSYQAREAVQDNMLSLRRVQELIEKASGKKLRDFENAWMHENRLSSVVQSAIHEMERKYYKPMTEAVKKLMDAANLEQEQVADYLMLKHGIERNREMAVRKALTDSEGKIDRDKLNDWYEEKRRIRKDASLDTWRKKQEAMDDAALMFGADMSRDYSGLTSMFDTDDLADCTERAYDEVEALENAHPVETEALGKAIKAMTHNTLDESFGSGLMDRKVYDELSNDMYDYYIPLRGFEETTSDEVYAYMDNDRGAFNAPLVRAKGRSSKSDNPIAYLKSIAESGIMQGERNKMKQTFLNMVTNHPSDLVSVREGVWAIFNPATGEWEAASFPESKVPRNATPADVQAAYEKWEEDMELRAKTDPNVKKISEAADVPYRVIGNRMNQHQVIVKRLGKSYTLTINGNPRLAMALNGLTNPNNTSNDGKVSAFVQQKVDALNRTLSAWYTTRNPDFVASNFMRDTFYTNTIVRAKEGNNYANHFHAHYAKLLMPGRMISLFSKYENGTLDLSKPMERDFHEFMMNGGETGYSNLRDLEHIKKQIAKDLKGGRMEDVKGLLDKLDLVNRAVENTARFAAYRTSRQQGRSVARSIFDAKEISVNFNKKGAGGTFFGATGQTSLWGGAKNFVKLSRQKGVSLKDAYKDSGFGIGNLAAAVGAGGRAMYVFFNAAIQGTTNLLHVMKINPAGTGAGLAAMFLMGAVLPMLLGGDDEKDYYDLPEHVRRNHLILPGVGDSWISIPLPIEYRIMYGMGELLTSWRTGHERGSNIGMKMLSMTGQALPLNFLEEGVDAFMPSALSPLWQVYNNRSWTGLPIYKDNEFNKDNPEYTKAYKNVNRGLYKFTKALYRWTFDEENQEAGINLNPAAIEHIAKGYFGGLVTTLDNIWKTGEMIAGEREFDWRNIPVGNRIFKTGDERTKDKRIQNEYFENVDKLEFMQSRERLLRKTKDGSGVPEADKLEADEDYKILVGSDVYKKYVTDPNGFKEKKKKADKLYRQRKEKGDSEKLERDYYKALEEANKSVR